jgi:hypothetical protein
MVGRDSIIFNTLIGSIKNDMKNFIRRIPKHLHHTNFISFKHIGSLIYFILIHFGISNANTKIPATYFESPLEGRWDLTLYNSGNTFPAWLEVQHSGTRTLVGRFVGQGGSARPISKVNFADGKVSFSIPPQWDTANNDLVFEASLEGDSLTGGLTMPDGKKFTLTGVRAPSLRRTTAPVWGMPIKLFDGKDLKGWHTDGPNQWKAVNGVMVSPASGSNIMTDQLFRDFKLHIEFRYPKGSNSGVYLRGRYEIQIIDSKGKEPLSIYLGGVYGFLPPTEMLAKDAGEWQSFDITLVGRLITLAVNDKTVICNQEIPGITGGALDSRESEPGPIMIQGDHGAVDFRNIIITPAR